jgi:hypothetical protein
VDDVRASEEGLPVLVIARLRRVLGCSGSAAARLRAVAWASALLACVAGERVASASGATYSLEVGAPSALGAAPGCVCQGVWVTECRAGDVDQFALVWLRLTLVRAGCLEALASGERGVSLDALRESAACAVPAKKRAPVE